MSARYETVRTYFIRHVWNEKKVRDAVAQGWITPGEFKEITGKDYE